MEPVVINIKTLAGDAIAKLGQMISKVQDTVWKTSPTDWANVLNKYASDGPESAAATVVAMLLKQYNASLPGSGKEDCVEALIPHEVSDGGASGSSLPEVTSLNSLPLNEIVQKILAENYKNVKLEARGLLEDKKLEIVRSSDPVKPPSVVGEYIEGSRVTRDEKSCMRIVVGKDAAGKFVVNSEEKSTSEGNVELVGDVKGEHIEEAAKLKIAVDGGTWLVRVIGGGLSKTFEKRMKPTDLIFNIKMAVQTELGKEIGLREAKTKKILVDADTLEQSALEEDPVLEAVS